MSAAPILMAAGGGIAAYGSIKANNDRAEAERQNAKYYEEQATYAAIVGARSLYLLGIRSDQLRASEVAGFAKGGVELSGSPLQVLDQESAFKVQNMRAIQAEMANRVSLAALKGQQATQMADNYSSFENQFLSAAPSLLRAGADYASYKAGK